MEEFSKEFKDEAWKEVQKSMNKLRELRFTNPAITKLITEHESIVNNYLGHLTRSKP